MPPLPALGPNVRTLSSVSEKRGLMSRSATAVTEPKLQVHLKPTPLTEIVEVTPQAAKQSPSMRSFLLDPPNIITVIGLMFSTYAIFAACTAQYNLACALIMFSCVADFYDGWVARRLGPEWGRTDKHRALGGELDSLIDTITFAVCPALITLQYSGLNPWVVPVLVIYLTCGVLRLAYYNTHGLAGNYYVGLSIDSNAPLYTLVFLLERFFAPEVFVWVLCGWHLALACMNTGTFKVYKIGTGGNHEFFPMTGALFLLGVVALLV